MFTGIVEELGEVIALEEHADSAVLRLRGPHVTEGVHHGQSIVVNGVCLTVIDDTDSQALAAGDFAVDVMPETLRASALADLRAGDPVNLERAMRSDGRFDGHIVQGHVDTTATLLEREPGERWDVVTFTLPEEIARYVVHKGSITIDGVSLTVSDLGAESFSVSLIPTTLAETTLGQRQVGQRVNVEVDVVAKYVERLVTR